MVGESAEGQDGYWPLVGGALGREGRGVKTAPNPSQPAALATAITVPASGKFYKGEKQKFEERSEGTRPALGSLCSHPLGYSVPGPEGSVAVCLTTFPHPCDLGTMH